MLEPNHIPNDPIAPRKNQSQTARLPEQASPRWYWPLGPLGERTPIVLATHEHPEVAIDLGYETRRYDRELFVPVYTPYAGVVTSCKETSDGYSLELDHLGHDWITRLEHLSKVFVATDRERGRRQRPCVRGGRVIGYAARSPTHVRFALVRKCGDHRNVAVPALPHLNTWSVPPCVLTREAA
jgi:hypothetical protein